MRNLKRYFIVDYSYGSVLYEEDLQGYKNVIGKFPTHDEAYEALKELEGKEEGD